MKDRENIDMSNLIKGVYDFPFNSFEDLRQAIDNNRAYLTYDTQFAIKSLSRLPGKGMLFSLKSKFIAILPTASIIGFVLYMVANQEWLMLLFTPILFISYVLLSSREKGVLRVIRILINLASVMGLVIGLVNQTFWLLSVSIALLPIWAGTRALDKMALREIRVSSLRDEDLFWKLWDNGLITIYMPNGDAYNAGFSENPLPYNRK